MPLFYMLFSVLSWSLLPLMGAWGLERLSVFDYIICTFIVGFVFSYAIVRALPDYKELRNDTLKRVDKTILAEIFIGCLAAVLSRACLFASFFYLSKAGATVIYEVWPIIAMYLTPLLIKRGWDKISTKDMGFSFLAFIGVAFLIYPEQGGGANDLPSFLRSYHMFLPLLGGVLMAMASVMETRVSHLLEDAKRPVASFFLVQVWFILGYIVLTIPFVLFWPHKPSVFTPQNIMLILFIGIFIQALGNIAYTIAVLRSKTSSIVVLWYLMPIFSVLWLYLAGQSAVTPFIVLGSIFVITSNLIITVKAEQSKAYTAAILTMLACGVYVYFVNGLAVDNFYDAISVPIVFYTILIAFVIDRLIRSDKLEEVLAIEVINHIEDHEDDFQDKAATYIKQIIAIVSTNDAAAVNDNYVALRNTHDAAMRPIHNKLDELALSKLRGTSFAEIFILLLVGVMIVAVSVVFRPANLVGDVFSVILSLTVMFIFFTVLDMQNQRRCFYLERDGQARKSMSSVVTGSFRREQILSAFLIVLVMLAFLGLLVSKRYPGLLG